MGVLETAEVWSLAAAEWGCCPGSEGNGMSLAASLSGVLRPCRQEHTFCLWALGVSVLSDLFLVSDLPIPVAPSPQQKSSHLTRDGAPLHPPAHSQRAEHPGCC